MVAFGDRLENYMIHVVLKVSMVDAKLETGFVIIELRQTKAHSLSWTTALRRYQVADRKPTSHPSRVKLTNSAPLFLCERENSHCETQ